MTSFKNIPTNIISGFLGCGKTTAIQYLIKQKPEAERWAIIVNEFGQIGIDGALLENDSVQIKEIPGGCLCCVSSQSLNVGLNKIIREVKPHRILIEPTGLGHPKKLIESLTGEFYKTVLDLRAVINLLDARQLSDKRYMEHETFIAQLELADVLVANKLDVYTEEDKQRFYDYASTCEPVKQKVVLVEYGRLQLEWLDIKHSANRQVLPSSAHALNTVSSHAHIHSHDKACEVNTSEWLMVEGHANDYSSIGWKISSNMQFVKEDLLKWLTGLFENPAVERVKAVMLTDNGWFSINHTRLEQAAVKRGTHSHSILEIISNQQLLSNELDEQLKSFISSKK